MALVDWTVTPSSFEVSGSRADVIVGFHNSVTLADFKEHLFCTNLETLKSAALFRISQLDETDPTADLKPALGAPLDFTPKPPDPPTPFELFQADVRTLKSMKTAIDLTIKKASDADWLALVASVTADLAGTPEWISAF